MTNQLTHTESVRIDDQRPNVPPDRPHEFEQLATHHSGRGRPLLRASAVGAGLALVAAVSLLAVTGDPIEAPQSPTQPVTQEQPAYLIIQNEVDAALAARPEAVAPVNQRSAGQIIQEEIEAALAVRAAARQTEPSAYSMIQDEIDAGLAAHRAAERES